MSDRAHRVTLAGTDRTFDVRPGESVLGAARRSGHWLPFECGWGGCGRCRATLEEGELALMFPDAPAIDFRDARRRRHLLCQSTPTSDVVVKTLGVSDSPPPERRTTDLVASLAEIRELGPDTAGFVFDLRTPTGVAAVADYRPGQYAILELAPGLRRCYSMAGLPGRTQVEFVAKHYRGRPGSARLFALRPGETIGIELPYGDMWLRDRDRPALLIAGGTGISAILAMVRAIAADPAWTKRPVHVLYGAATADDLVCWAELTTLVAAIPRGHVHAALVVADQDWPGTRGLITTALASLLADADAYDHDPREGLIYLAGPPPMARAVQDVLAAHGVQLDRIHVDSFG